MSKLKSIMYNRTHGHLGEQRKSCSDCVHVMPGMQGDDVTCKIYTFKYQEYNVRKNNSLLKKQSLNESSGNIISG
jgi:hypothetical protein